MKNNISRDFKIQDLITKDFKITKHFSFFEMSKTSYNDFQQENRRLALSYVNSLKTLCKDILEPLRQHFGKPLIITSGFRCYALNKAIGSSSTSQHLKGQAADFYIENISDDKIIKYLVENLDFNFGQLILEKNHNSSWIHISLGTPFRESEKCRQVLFIDKTKDDKMLKNENNKLQNLRDSKKLI